MRVQPPVKSSNPLSGLPPLPALPTNIPVPDVKKVGTMITNLVSKVPIPASMTAAAGLASTPTESQKESQEQPPPPKQ